MRKGQSEIVSFVLLFLIGVTLFMTAIVWGRGSFERNLDINKIASTETLIKELDSNIQTVARFGGRKEMEYRSDSTVILNDIGSEDTIEMRAVIQETLPSYWVNLTTPDSFSLIREKLEGDIFIVQLSYPNRQIYGIDLFTTGSKESVPRSIAIEKDSSYVDSGMTIIKIKITFE